MEGEKGIKAKNGGGLLLLLLLPPPAFSSAAASIIIMVSGEPGNQAEPDANGRRKQRGLSSSLAGARRALVWSEHIIIRHRRRRRRRRRRRLRGVALALFLPSLRQRRHARVRAQEIYAAEFLEEPSLPPGCGVTNGHL